MCFFVGCVPQVAACWSGVSSVLVDDFVGCGTDQILLVLHDQNPSESITNFIMTDLCGIMYSVSQSHFYFFKLSLKIPVYIYCMDIMVLFCY